MENSGKKSVRTISFVMALTLIGKLMGLLRDRLLTINYGSGMAANAFLTASRIPRVFFDAVFASAIAASFIPVFNELCVKKDRRDVDGFAGNFITVMGLLTLAITALGVVFSGPLVTLFADGYDAKTAELCVRLTRIMFPTVLFTGVAYSFVGILQSLDEFRVPALISVVSNGLIILYFCFFNDGFGITGLALAFLIGWLMQALVQIPSLAKKGFVYRPGLSLHSEGMRKVFALMLPVMISTWVQPINITINSKFGSRLFDGAGVAAIELSSNLYLIIVGVFVLSVTNVIFPRLARLRAGDEGDSFRETLRLTLHSTLYFVVPMTAGLMLLATPLVSLIYGGGEFGEFSVGITARALVFVSLGMPGYAVQAVVCRAYFAEQNGKIPLFAGLASILVNIILCILLMDALDVAGLAIASAASITVNAVLLLIPLKKRGLSVFSGKFAADMVKSLLAALVMAAVAWGTLRLLPAYGKLVTVLAPAAAGIIVYFLATWALKLDEALVVINIISKCFHRKGNVDMHNILKGSFIYRFFAVICAWFSRQWRDSPLITWFLRPGRGEAMSESSVFARLWAWLHGWLYIVFHALRLDKATEHSIFRRPFFWCLLTVSLAPILPTMAVIGLSAVSVFSLLLCFGAERDRKPFYAPANKFIILYIFVYIVAMFASVTVSGSLYGGLVTILFVLFSLVFQNSVSTRRQLDIIVWALVLSGCLVSAYGVYQYVFGVTGAAAWIDDDMFSEITTRVYSTLQNPNVLAEYLLLIIPFGVAGFISEKKLISKLIFLCCTGAMCLCMLLTFARGGYLGLIFAAAVFFIILDRRFILAGIAALIVMYFVLPDMIISRFTSIGNMADTSTSYRVAIWMGSVAMLRDYWLCGIGPGTAAFNMIYPAYSYNSAMAQHSHNLFLQITCDSGVCGIVLFFLIVFHYFKDTCSALASTSERKTRLYLMASVSGVSGFLVQSMTDYSFYNYRVMLMFWASLALGALLARRDKLPEVTD